MTSIRIVMLLLLFLVACEDSSEEPEKSQSPFSRSLASVAMDEPCRYIGTFHKESRQRLEELRAHQVVSLDEWKCMARALAALDDELTRECKEEEKSIELIEIRQSELYAPCLSPANPKVVRCSLLSSEDRCF